MMCANYNGKTQIEVTAIATTITVNNVLTMALLVTGGRLT